MLAEFPLSYWGLFGWASAFFSTYDLPRLTARKDYQLAPPLSLVVVPPMGAPSAILAFVMFRRGKFWSLKKYPETMGGQNHAPVRSLLRNWRGGNSDPS